MNIRKLGTVL